MAEQLYRRLTFKNVGKVYVPLVHGKHVVRTFKRARDAESHTLKVRARLARLRAAARQVNGGQEVSRPAG